MIESQKTYDMIPYPGLIYMIMRVFNIQFVDVYIVKPFHFVCVWFAKPLHYVRVLIAGPLCCTTVLNVLVHMISLLNYVIGNAYCVSPFLRCLVKFIKVS